MIHMKKTDANEWICDTQGVATAYNISVYSGAVDCPKCLKLIKQAQDDTQNMTRRIKK